MLCLGRGEGVCHIGRIAGSFELVNDPPWADKWLDSHVNERKKQKIGDEEWIANVVQKWPVEGFAPVPFPLIPRWISYRLLSRDTIGWIFDRPVGKQSAVDVLEQLYEGKFSVYLEPTGDRREIEGRLLDWVSPSMFEHLVCELLQLEHPDLHWVHTGGSGDGGTDGMAINGAGQITALLQCKLHLKENPLNLGDALRKRAKTWEIEPEIYVASLYDKQSDRSEEGITFLSRRGIAELLLKHRSRCGFAETLKVSS